MKKATPPAAADSIDLAPIAAQESVDAYRAGDQTRLATLAEAAMELAKHYTLAAKARVGTAKTPAEVNAALGYGRAADRAMREALKCIALGHRLDRKSAAAARPAQKPVAADKDMAPALKAMVAARLGKATFH